MEMEIVWPMFEYFFSYFVILNIFKRAHILFDPLKVVWIADLDIVGDIDDNLIQELSLRDIDR